MAARRKRITYVGNPWPDHWDVSTEWTVPAEQKLPRGSIRDLVGGKNEIATREKGHSYVWYKFTRIVHNLELDVWWIDAFQLPPHGGFASFRPEQVVNTRRHIPPRPKGLAKVDKELPDGNA